MKNLVRPAGLQTSQDTWTAQRCAYQADFLGKRQLLCTAKIVLGWSLYVQLRSCHLPQPHAEADYLYQGMEWLELNPS